MSSPKNKKCRHWKVFEINYPQTLQILGKRGPRGLDVRLSQHYIGPFYHFLTFCRKKFPGLTQKLQQIFVCKTIDSFNKCKKIPFWGRESKRNTKFHFWADVMLKLGPLLLKFARFEGGYFKPFFWVLCPWNKFGEKSSVCYCGREVNVI